MSFIESVFEVSVFLDQILDYVEINDKLKLRQVSRCMCRTIDLQTHALYLNNLKTSYSSLSSLCLKLQHISTINLGNICWSSNSTILKALRPCVWIKNFENIHLRCEKSAKEFAFLLKKQKTDISKCSFYIYGGGVKITKHILKYIRSVNTLEIHIRDSVEISCDPFVRLLKRCGPRLVTLILEFQIRTSCALSSCVCKTGDILKTMFNFNSGLQNVSLNVPCLGSYLSTTEKVPLLKLLRIHNAIITCKTTTTLQSLNFDHLSHLELQDIHSLTFEESLLVRFKQNNCPPLQTITWRNCWRTSPHVFLEPQLITALSSGRCVQSLKSFNLEGRFLSAQTLQCLPKLRNSLENLSLSNARIASIPFDVLCQSISEMVKLKKLDISGLFLEQGMQHLLHQLCKLNCLEELILSSNTIEPISLISFLNQNASIVKTLIMEYCIADENTLFFLLQHFKLLPVLHTLNIVCYFSISKSSSAQYTKHLFKSLTNMPQIRTLTIPAPSTEYLPNVVTVLNQCTHLNSLVIRVPVEDDCTVEYIYSTLSKGLPGVKLSVW